LLVILKDAGDPQRPAVLPVIANLAPDHPPALTALLAALSDRDDATREAAASAFVTLNHAGLAGASPNRNEAQKHLSELAQAASDGNARVRLAAAIALVDIQPSYPAAAPALLAALRDKDSAVRLAAADSLWRIPPQTPGMRPALLAALDDPDPRMLQSLVRFLEMMPRAQTQPVGAEGGVPLGLISPDVALRRTTAEALGQAGVGAIESVGRLLVSASDDSDAGVRRAAAMALKKILTAAVQSIAAP
jgi:HEAT repeat protein